MLHSGEDRELVPATAAPFAADDEGAVLKDMIMPRPSLPAGVGSRGNVAAQKAAHKKGLADFRTQLWRIPRIHAFIALSGSRLQLCPWNKDNSWR